MSNININEILLNYSKRIYVGEGNFQKLNYTISVTKGEKAICEMENILKCSLPRDYKEFLLQYDGIRFDSAAELELYGIQSVFETIDTMGYIDGIIPIGYCLEDYIVINCNRISSDNYIYAGDAYCPDEYYSLECNFSKFIDRYFMSNFINFWRWYLPKEKYTFIA